MPKLRQKYNKNIRLILLLPYTLLSFLTLTIFPRMHSDESWLGGLSMAYFTEKTPYTSEPFFDLYPRAIHLMKIWYHLITGLSLNILGYSLTAMRLPSLIAGLIALILWYLLLNQENHHPAIQLLWWLALAIMPHFIYTSHFSRQEIFLLVALLASYLLWMKADQHPRFYDLIPIMIGLSIGFHPNAFLLGVSFGLVYVYRLLHKQIGWRTLMVYIGILGASAMTYISFSLIMNPSFFSGYLAYGDTLGVTAAPYDRLKNFYYFFYKLYHQIGGTYYLLDLRPYFFLALILMVLSIFTLFMGKKNRSTEMDRENGQHIDKAYSSLIESWLLIMGNLIGLLIIGRFNQTSIIFTLVHLYLIYLALYNYVFWTNSNVPTRRPIIKKVLLTGLVLLTLWQASNLYEELRSQPTSDYEAYMDFLKANIPENAHVLGNLSGGFSIDPYHLYDIRNLYYLTGDISDYIHTNQISYVVHYEEYDYIHRNPKWQILYGDDTRYYDDYMAYLQAYGSPVATMTSPYYGNRIIQYQGDYPWQITIYKLDSSRVH